MDYSPVLQRVWLLSIAEVDTGITRERRLPETRLWLTQKYSKNCPEEDEEGHGESVGETRVQGLSAHIAVLRTANCHVALRRLQQSLRPRGA